MTKEAIYARLNIVFRDVFDDESITIKEETTAKDVEDWDSFGHINLIVAIEGEFGLKFTMGEVTGMHNVGEMATIIAERATK
jgi:acyl carrier protein